MAVVYTQTEADYLIRMAKWIDRDAWQEHGPDGNWQRAKLAVFPTDSMDGRLSLGLELERHLRSSECRLQLWANLRPKGRVYLARYDHQLDDHENPPGKSPKRIKPRELHGHTYSADLLERTRHWDQFAFPLHIPSAGSPKQVWERLAQRFLADMNITIGDAQTRGDLLGQDW